MRVVLCNCAPDEAHGLARALVHERLAACVNQVTGVRSVYLWQGKVEEDSETTLIIKTTPESLGALSDRIRELHSYDVPEIVVLEVDVDQSDPAYVGWVREVMEATA